MAIQTEIELTAPVDLSSRLRSLRERQGLRQSEIARRMALDPSIPSLWEQGKRPVPSRRLQPLADALGVSLEELLEASPTGAGDWSDRPEREARVSREPRITTVAAKPTARVTRVVVRPAVPRVPSSPEEMLRLWASGALRSLVTSSLPKQAEAPGTTWAVALDWQRAELARMNALLRARLCEEHRQTAELANAPSKKIVEKIARHCGKAPEYLAGTLPVLERVFRLVLRGGGASMRMDDLERALRATGSAPDLQVLLRVGRESRTYPLSWPGSAL
jgi:transcriptional regulator with XRE-family HTH domain